MKIYSVIGINIRKLRNSKKLSQEELAFRASMDRSYLSEVESGQKKISVGMLDKIAAALNVKITELFAGYKGDRN